tara:strand:- start:7604 stop:8098 length:495 start_codon:yes stop_codon:yes gene_type:complete
MHFSAEADTSHFDAIDDMEEPVSFVDSGEAAATAGLMTKDDFFSTFQFMFAAPNMLPVAPFPLKSLPIGEADVVPARAASDAVYDIAVESPYLRWLVEPSSLWMQRTLAIGTFAGLKLMAVRAEIAARPGTEAKSSNAANDNSAAANDNEADGSTASGVVVLPE